MKIDPSQLDKHAQNKLLPVYLVFGDEPLQMMEAMHALRTAARAQGCGSREVLEAGKDFDWNRLGFSANSMSLFAERRILELRLPGGSPGQDGAKALIEYAERPADDAVLLIESGKIDPKSQKTKWFQALEGVGGIVQIWPVKPAALPQWIERRLRACGLQADREAAALLAMRTEGNLLAAAQEIEKLSLLHGQPGKQVRLDVRQVADAVSDSSRYSVYDLVDAALGGETARSLRILGGLKQEAAATPLVLWALQNEIRSLYDMKQRLQSGEPPARVLSEVWDSRKSRVEQALKRLSAGTWGILLNLCAGADLAVKGLREEREWDVLREICLGLSAGYLFRRIDVK
ncbi:MAG TPA: DNA polymerase III subunit delta [Gammaproteobacteria bacterium]|nr:DNA polymerase III subunit delta [Gammaproteobacteria bacterium]